MKFYINKKWVIIMVLAEKNIKIFFLIAVLSLNQNCLSNFADAWKRMQNDYHRVDKKSPDDSVTLNRFYHPHWLDAKNKIKKIINGSPNAEFVKMSPLGGCMLRGGYDNFQRYEKQFLTECICQDTQMLLASAQETNFLNLPREVPQLNISTSTLGHLFYIAKVLENVDYKNINTIIEFGGGYGNLARLFKQILPDVTIIMFDLPEMIALQALFLRQTLSNISIVVHDVMPAEFVKGAIHLVPVYLMNDLDVDTDLFISTFALSEATDYTQEIVFNKSFFNAKYCYIVGQMHGWGNSFKFVHHSKMLSSVRKNFYTTWCQPYHHGLVSHQESYEILGKRL